MMLEDTFLVTYFAAETDGAVRVKSDAVISPYHNLCLLACSMRV